MRRTVLAAIIVLLAACATRGTPGAVDPFTDAADYRASRTRLIERDRASRLGASLVFTPDEEAANRRLMAMKQAELDRTRAYFPPAKSFLANRTKEQIEVSPVFAVMRQLPKGGVLHAHGSALGDYRWLVSYATYRPDCYIFVGEGPATPRGALRVSATLPGDGWRLVSELRAAAPDARAFDEAIYQSITLGEEDMQSADIWQDFANAFRLVGGVINDPTVAAAYWGHMLSRLIDENVQYLESRTSSIDAAIVRDAQRRDPDFDVKFIPVAGRSGSRERVAQLMTVAIERAEKEPDRIKGFDLVEEEDRTNTTFFYIEELLAGRREAGRRGVDLPFVLHSGETNRAEDENIYDAVLLGAPRIGHALSLVKHPLLMDIVKARGVAIEVCPISNQLLGYVHDLRNHPAVHYINAGIPVVLSPDDPAIMQHSLSHDFYVAFMAWGLNLRSLKQLAMNSLTHSMMNAEEKRQALASWERRWATFVAWLNTR